MKKKKLTGIAATALLALTLISINFNDSDDRSIQTAGSVAETPPAINLDQQSENAYLVVKVVDGDTIIVDIDGAEERVRLIGVDTPESVHPDADRNVPYGAIASDFTKEQLQGKRVTLEYDVQGRDRYGRILAYVYLDGKMFNKTLLEEGHAKVATYPPNVKYVDDFTAIQEQAIENKKGVWSYEAFDGNKGTQSNTVEGSQATESNIVEGSQATDMGNKMDRTEAAYVGNSNSMKFHRSNCDYARQISERNIVFFETRADAIDGEYQPCKACNP